MAERLGLQLDSMEDRHRSTAGALAGLAKSFDHSTRRITWRLNSAIALLQDDVRAATDQLSRDLDAVRGELRNVAQLRATVDRLTTELEAVQADVRDLAEVRERKRLKAVDGP